MEDQLVDELPQPRALVRVGVSVASTAVAAALNPRPEAGLFGTRYGTYGFNIGLFLLFLFGMWFIILGWVAADDPPEEHNVVMRNAIRAAQLALVFAIGLYEFYAN